MQRETLEPQRELHLHGACQERGEDLRKRRAELEGFVTAVKRENKTIRSDGKAKSKVKVTRNKHIWAIVAGFMMVTALLTPWDESDQLPILRIWAGNACKRQRQVRGHEEAHQETTISWMTSLMRRCGDIQPNPGPTQSAAAAAAATVDAHHKNVFTPRTVCQSWNRLQRETDLGMLRDREHVSLDPAQKMRIGCKCTRDRCYHYHNVGVCEFVFPTLQNGELGYVTWNCTTLRNLTRDDLTVGQADQWSVICLQDTLHWSHDSLQWMAPQSTIHTNVLQLVQFLGA